MGQVYLTHGGRWRVGNARLREIEHRACFTALQSSQLIQGNILFFDIFCLIRIGSGYEIPAVVVICIRSLVHAVEVERSAGRNLRRHGNGKLRPFANAARWSLPARLPRHA